MKPVHKRQFNNWIIKLMLQPVFKNHLQKIQLQDKIKKHKRNIREAKSNVSLRQKPYAQLPENPKKQYFLETKYTEIERQNRLLFEKISKIMTNQRRNGKTTLSPIRSLNNTFRKKQHSEIQIQNIKILNRIKSQRPTISFNETQRSFWMSRKRSANISNIHKHLIDYY